MASEMSPRSTLFASRLLLLKFFVLLGTAPPSGKGGLFRLGSATSCSSALGGGLDWDVAPFVAVGVLQIDSLHTHLHGASQNQPRASSGIVFHF